MYQKEIMRRRERQRKRRERLYGMGLCIRCGKRPQEPGLTLCRECSESSKAYRASRYRMIKKDGLCIVCLKRFAEPGKTMCPDCAAEQHKAYADRIKKLRDSGVCTRCGKVKVTGTGYRLCAACRKKQAEYMRRRYAEYTRAEILRTHELEKE